MSSRNEKRVEMAANVSDLLKPQESKSTSVPYPSPPNSPLPTNTHIPEVPTEFRHEARSARRFSPAPVSPPTTPPRHSSAPTVAEKEPAENKVDVSALRTRLGLDSRLCGGRTKSGRPCRIPSPAANRAQITSQLDSMRCLTQSSAELDAALDKLVMLVHCNYHDNGLPKKSRVEAWTTEFPVGKAATNPAESVDKQIRKVLRLESTECIGIAVSTRSRCQRGIGGQKVLNCEATIDEIVKPEVYLNDTFLDGLLKVLETNMYCHLHINKTPLKMVGSWKSSIVDIREEQLVKSVGRIVPREMDGRSRAPNTPVSVSPSSKTSVGPVLRNGHLTTPNFDRDLSTYWPAAYDISPFNIITRNSAERLADYKSSYAKVKSEMTKDLDSRHPTSGYVYMYEVDGNEGFVKIGYTGRSIEERHQEWNFSCNRAPKALYPIPSGTVAAVQNPRRVEELCHAELDHRRIRIYCKACLKPHLEWFEVSPAEAIAVIKKWSMWMATGPYQTIQLRSGAKWTIREEEMKRTRDMDRFMKEIADAPNRK